MRQETDHAVIAATALVLGTADAETTTAEVGALATTAGCGKAPAIQNGDQTIQNGGKSRSFILSIPDNYDNTRPYRLVFGFHWWGGTANDVASGGSNGDVHAHYGLRRLANNSALWTCHTGANQRWAMA
jgi:hypothetical protein